MSDIAKRLRASVKYDAHNGNAEERSICGRQMIEAAAKIERLLARLEEMAVVIETYKQAIEVANEVGMKIAVCGLPPEFAPRLAAQEQQ